MSKSVVVFLSITAAACGGGDDGAGPPYVCGVGPEMPELVLPGERAPWDVMATSRDACAFEAGDHTRTSLCADPDQCSDAALPASVEHVIVLLRENRSFDHFLGAYEPADGPPAGAWNPDPATPGERAPWYHEVRYCPESFNHHWGATHFQYNNGRMDGFVASSHYYNPGNSRGAMGYFNRDDLPLYYWLADNFAISDRYFSSLLGPTMPNLMYYFRATSCGYYDNADPLLYIDCADRSTTIFSLLDDAGVSYGVYSDAKPATGAAAKALNALPVERGVGSIEDFIDDVNADTLPSFVFVEPNYGHSGFGTQNDDHPPVNIQVSQQFVHRIVAAVMSKPEVWGNTVLFITWDEHGGYYDHVPPPKACPPDGAAVYDFASDRLGIRVPFFVVSPFAKKGYVSHYVADHTSILRFVEHWKDLPAMTRRDANAWPLLDMFDFGRSDAVPPPGAELAPLGSDPIHVASCGAGAAVSP